MKRVLGSIPAQTAAVVFVLALAAPALAAVPPRIAAARQDQQTIIDNIAQAQTAIAHGQRSQAIDSVGRAETALLNAQQSGAYRNPQSLAALTRAHDELLQGKAQAAQQALAASAKDIAAPLAG